MSKLNANQINEIKNAIRGLPTKEAQLAKTLELMDFYLGGKQAQNAPANTGVVPPAQQKQVSTYGLSAADIAILDKQRQNPKAAIEKLQAAFDKATTQAQRKKINDSIGYLQQF